jgi:hypothetical protein
MRCRFVGSYGGFERTRHHADEDTVPKNSALARTCLSVPSTDSGISGHWSSGVLDIRADRGLPRRLRRRTPIRERRPTVCVVRSGLPPQFDDLPGG